MKGIYEGSTLNSSPKDESYINLSRGYYWSLVDKYSYSITIRFG